MSTPRPLPIPQRGATLVVTLILLFAGMVLTIAGLSAATSNLRIAGNYRSATQALLAAEAGQVHAQERICDWGVIHFNDDVLPFWEEILGSAWQELSGYPGVRYSASVSEDPTDPLGHAILTTVGRSENESTRRIVSRLEVDLVFSPGAIYIPAEGGVNATFNGSSFLVDGFDRNLDGSPNPAGNVPGITTRSDDAKAVVEGALNPVQADSVIGDGHTPSVELSYGLTGDRIQNTIVPNILAQPNVITDPVANRVVTGNATFGTLQNPQITYFTGDLDVRANGDASGAGILVIDGGLTINGSLDFTGLIIVRGTTQITSVSGAAVLLGAIWTTSLNLNVAGAASITYSTEALELAADIGLGDLLPQCVRAKSWQES